jgi:hypothetical protein
MTACLHEVTHPRKHIRRVRGRMRMEMWTTEVCVRCGADLGEGLEPPPEKETADRLVTGRRPKGGQKTTRETDSPSTENTKQTIKIILSGVRK